MFALACSGSVYASDTGTTLTRARGFKLFKCLTSNKIFPLEKSGETNGHAHRFFNQQAICPPTPQPVSAGVQHDQHRCPYKFEMSNRPSSPRFCSNSQNIGDSTFKMYSHVFGSVRLSETCPPVSFVLQIILTCVLRGADEASQ